MASCEWEVQMLEFRHYVGLACHLTGCTQAVFWPAQGPGLCSGTKIPLGVKVCPLLIFFTSRSFFWRCRSLCFSPPPSLSLPFSLPFPFPLSPINPTLRLSLHGVFYHLSWSSLIPFYSTKKAQSHKLKVSVVFCICCNPQKLVSDASEGMDVLGRWRQVGKKQRFPSSMSLYKHPEAGMKYIKGLSSHLKTRIKGVHLSDSISRSKVHVFLP